MSEVLKKTLGELTAIISEQNPRKRKKLLQEAGKREDVIRSIVELSRNTVLKNVPLDNNIKK